MILIYEWLITPALIVMAAIASIFSVKIRAGFLQRFDRPSKVLDDCIWIHVSSGEWEYAKPVVRELKRSGQKILVTYFSPSIRSALENSPDVDVCLALPPDHRFLLRPIFRHHPRALLVARSDLWPVMLREAARRRIPCYLFSARMTDEMSESKTGLKKWFFLEQMRYLKKVFCVGAQDESNFLKIGVSAHQLEVLGDTRYDQVFHRLGNKKPLKWDHWPHPLMVCGSTWPSDEAILLPAIKALESTSDLRFVIVPHEPSPHRLDLLRSQCLNLGLSHLVYSEVKQWTEERVLIVDVIGVLAELYSQADFAFVGNSFERAAVHSVMEPLAADNLTFVGPLHHNSREAVEFSMVPLGNDFHAIEVICSSHELVIKLRNALASRESLSISDQLEARRGATERLIQQLNL